MKKIFAFILATIMVLSLVPAYAFAAVTNCPKTHSVEECRELKIGFTAFGTPVPATCTKEGYTIYKCDDCGVLFPGDFTEATGHTWVSTADAKHEDTAANCATDTDGIAWVKCSSCPAVGDNLCTIDNCGRGYIVIEAEHEYEFIEGIGCEAKYGCANCDGEFYKDVTTGKYTETFKGHDWKLTAILTQPAWVNGKYVKGEAQFNCKVEGCLGEKTAPILNQACEHHTLDEHKIQDFVAAACNKKGQKAVYKCPDCLKCFFDEDGDGTIDGALVDKKGNATTDLTYAEIPAETHEKSKVVVHENCIKVYFCDKCDEEWVDVTEDTHMKSERAYYIAPSCIIPGKEGKYCYACDTSYELVIPATKHEGFKVELEVTATCSNPGGTYVCCTSPTCTLPDETIRIGNSYTTRKVVEIKDATAIDADAHNLVYFTGNSNVELTEKPTASCQTSVMVIITYCKNGCDEYNYVPEYVGTSGHKMVTYREYYNCDKASSTTINGKAVPQATYTKRVEKICTVCSFVEYTDTPVEPKINFTSEEEAKLYHGEIMYVYDAKGNKTAVPYKAPIANLGTKVAGYVAPTCNVKGRAVWDCADCQLPVFVDIATITHAAKAGTTKVAVAADKCDATGTLEYFECVYCGKLVADLYASIGDEYLKDNSRRYKVIASAAEAVVSGCVFNLERKQSTVCTAVYYWECSECGKTYENYDAKTEKKVSSIKHNWNDLSVGKVATCNSDGTLQVRYCKTCKRLEVNQLFADGTVPYASTDKKTVKFENKELKIKDIVVRKSATKTEKKTLVITKNGTIGTDSASKAALKVPMISHVDHLTADPSKVAVNTAKSHIKLINSNTNRQDHTTAIYKNYKCNVDGCDYEYITDYQFASADHVNKYGQIISEKCTDTVVDRICIYCPANNNEIEADHGDSKVVTPGSSWTCDTDGFDFWHCTACGGSGVTNYKAKSEEYHDDPEFLMNRNNYDVVEAAPNYANDSEGLKVVCKLCEALIVDEHSEASINKAGLEIVLSLDSEVYTLGSIVYLTVSLDSIKGVDVWGLNFNIDYDAKNLEFLGETADIDWVTENFTDLHDASPIVDYKEVTDANGKTSIVKVPTGRVAVAANARNDVFVKGSQDLVVLKFKVISNAPVSFEINAYDEFKDEATGKYSYVPTLAVVDETGVSVDTIYCAQPNKDLDSGKNLYKAYKGIQKGAEVASLLDMNGDNQINISDIRDIYLLVANNDYDVKADLNFDGVVDLMHDVAKAYEVLVGKTSIYEVAGVMPTELHAGAHARAN